MRIAEVRGLQGCCTKAFLGSNISSDGIWQNRIRGALGFNEISMQSYLESGHVQLCVVGECHVLT